MKWEDYDDLVIKRGGRQWPYQYAWISPVKGQFVFVGGVDSSGHWMTQDDSKSLHQSAGRWYYTETGNPQIYGVWFTPRQDLNPHQYRVLAENAAAPTGGASQPALGRRPAAPQPAPGRRPAAPQPAPGRRPAAPQAQHWVARGNPPHAYRGNVDLGLLVNDHQVVKATNGGRLWALYNLLPDGGVNFVGRYGSVPGAPPPPNAHLNDAPQQFYPPPPPMPPAPPPQYVYPVAADPTMYPGAVPAYADPGVYQPAYAQPVYAQPYPDPYAYSQTSVYMYGQQQQPQPDLATAAFYGAAYGAQEAINEALAAEQQAQFDVSVYGSYGADAGGYADIYAAAYGDVDPSMGGMLQPYF